MHLYIGNLPESVTDEKLRVMFEEFGQVRKAEVVLDKQTGRSQCYGFVEMPVKSEARHAIEGLRSKDAGAGPLRVRLLKPGDEFHQSAKRAGGTGGPSGGKSVYHGDLVPRGAGAIRRGGKRGG